MLWKGSSDRKRQEIEMKKTFPLLWIGESCAFINCILWDHYVFVNSAAKK